MSIGINWNDYPVFFKRGVCTKKQEYTIEDPYTKEKVARSRWIIDDNTPIFSQNREYIGLHLRPADDH